MKHFSASVTINATPETVWNILLDVDNYTVWDPNMARIEGRIAMGESITFYTKINPDQGFPVKTVEMTPHQTITLQGGMPMGLFKSVRIHTLQTHDDHVHFTTEETFSGLLLPLFGRTIPDLNPLFEQFCEGLKAHAERS